MQSDQFWHNASARPMLGTPLGRSGPRPTVIAQRMDRKKPRTEVRGF